MDVDAARTIAVRRVGPGASRPGEREVAIEMPIAVSFLGIGYAVMMASPADLEDFAIGFALAERIIDAREQVRAVTMLKEQRGLLLNIEVSSDRQDIVLQRVRHRASDSSCGLCGIENLDQALRPLPAVQAPAREVSASVVFQALAKIRDHQRLNRRTGAVHAAALFDGRGSLVAIREDVGRHNAFDKLVGHCLRNDLDPASGFVVLTSRCSYELVEKAAVAGVSLLVTVSAPTSLAVERAGEAGLTLIALARSDEMLAVADPHGLFA